MIGNLEIENFKSIKHLKIDGLKKINLLIGKPNTGKSNIIEALSVFSLHFISGNKDLIRYEKISNIFYDNNVTQLAKIKAGDLVAVLGVIHNYGFGLISHSDLFALFTINNFSELYNFWEKIEFFKAANWKLAPTKEQFKLYQFFQKDNYKLYTTIFNFENDKINLSSKFRPEDFKSPIFRFKFKLGNKYNNTFSGFLLPPYADNLVYMLMSDPDLYDEFGKIFAEYGLELVIDSETKTFEIQKKIGFRVYKYPFSLVADTLQRIIFYLSIIRFTKDKTIILEEPETHSFPPYVRLLAEKIIDDQSNQYFISTHNPYMVSKFLEKAFDQTNIILTYFEDYQTKVKVLSDEEKQELIEFNEDIFFNYEKYLD